MIICDLCRKEDTLQTDFNIHSSKIKLDLCKDCLNKLSLIKDKKVWINGLRKIISIWLNQQPKSKSDEVKSSGTETNI